MVDVKDAIIAQFKDIRAYVPQHGDYFVWSKWFTTWHGFVVDYDANTDVISIIVAGVPFLLLTMPAERQHKETIKLKLSQIKGASHGKFAVLQRDAETGSQIWYV